MKIKNILIPLFAVLLAGVGGCAAQATSHLTPDPRAEQTESASAVKTECAAEAAQIVPKSLSFLEVIPPTTYMTAYNVFAACAQKRGYETQCQSSEKVLCGLNIIGY